jgi:hypothetical protein
MPGKLKNEPKKTLVIDDMLFRMVSTYMLVKGLLNPKKQKKVSMLE